MVRLIVEFVSAGRDELFPVLPLPLREGRVAGVLPLGRATHVMGILNVTPDSFSDGGRLTVAEDAVSQAASMLASGDPLYSLNH
jgi:hypothetical protein